MADQPLTQNDIAEQYQGKLFVQDYSKKPTIEGVQIVELKNMVGEDGDFSELVRLNENGELQQFPGFFLRQVSRTKMIPGSIKAWHIHYNQDDIWHVPPSDHLLVGLWDIRKNSSTKDLTMRLALGGGKGHLVLIPRGIAHGAVNVSSKNATILYFINEYFDIEKPDEVRLPWNSLGAEFWQAVKG